MFYYLRNWKKIYHFQFLSTIRSKRGKQPDFSIPQHEMNYKICHPFKVFRKESLETSYDNLKAWTLDFHLKFISLKGNVKESCKLTLLPSNKCCAKSQSCKVSVQKLYSISKGTWFFSPWRLNLDFNNLDLDLQYFQFIWKMFDQFTVWEHFQSIYINSKTCKILVETFETKFVVFARCQPSSILGPTLLFLIHLLMQGKCQCKREI